MAAIPSIAFAAADIDVLVANRQLLSSFSTEVSYKLTKAAPFCSRKLIISISPKPAKSVRSFASLNSAKSLIPPTYTLRVVPFWIAWRREGEMVGSSLAQPTRSLAPLKYRPCWIAVE